MAPFQLLIDPILLRRHGQDDAGGVRHPRYDAYPTCDYFVAAFGEREVRDRIGAVGQGLALYLHLPFCETNCRYCGCRKVAVRQRERVQKYIKCLEREIALAGAACGERRRVLRFHWRCAMPDTLELAELGGISRALGENFTADAASTWTVDMEARPQLPGRAQALAAMGFNELSLLVQDTGARAEESIARCIGEAREAGFRSVQADLVYGYPKQRLDRFSTLLETLVANSPDCIRLLPHQEPPGALRPGESESRPAAAPMLAHGAGLLVAAGYLHLGNACFVKPLSPLAVAKTLGRLQYGPEGFTVLSESDVLGFGLSAVSRVGSSYWQNLAGIDEYCSSLEAGRMPVWRGLELSPDDLVRRAVIQSLICNFRVSMESIERGHLINFRRYFARELDVLHGYADEGLVELEPDWIVVTPQGKLVVQAICAAFDRQRVTQQRRKAEALI